MMIQPLQIEICEPLAGVRPDRQSLWDTTDDLINHFENPLILDDPAKFVPEDILIHIRIEFLDVQLDEVSALFVVLNPTFYRASRAINATIWDATIGMLIHSSRDRLFNCNSEHPVDDVIRQTGTVNLAGFSSGGMDFLLAHRLMLPTAFQLREYFSSVSADLFGIQFVSKLRVGRVVAQSPMYHVVTTLVDCTKLDSGNSRFHAAEVLPQMAKTLHIFSSFRLFNNLLSRSSRIISVLYRTTEKDAQYKLDIDLPFQHEVSHQRHAGAGIG